MGYPRPPSRPGLGTPPGMEYTPLPSRPGWDTPPDLGWGTPAHHSDLAGVPHTPGILRWGTPLHHPDLAGVPPTPDLRWGTSPPPSRTGQGTPPFRKCEQTENITFPHPSDAGGNNALGKCRRKLYHIPLEKEYEKKIKIEVVPCYGKK